MIIGQLFYGWAARGAEGVNKEQIIAGSGVLSDRHEPLTRLVLDACYLPPREAFGWIEHRGARVVFLRNATGVDGRGRPGNFFVHALVAEAGALPPAVLAGLWGASIWERDLPPGPVVTDLDAIDDHARLGLARVPEPPPEVLRDALAGHLANLARGLRSSLDVEAGEAVTVAAAIAAALPSHYGVPAFSTAEDSDRAHRYDLVAGQPPTGQFSPIGTDRAAGAGFEPAAELLLAAANGDATARGVVEALVAQSPRLADFAVAIRAWVQGTDPESVDVRARSAALRLAAGDKRLGAGLLDNGRGRRLLARAYAAAVPQAAALIRSGATSERASALADQLAVALGEIAPDDALARLVPLAAAGDVAALAARRVAERWLHDGRLRELSGPAAARLLELVGTRHTSPAVDAVLHDHRLTRALLAERGLAPQMRAAAVASHPEAVEPVELAAALAERNGFAAALLASAGEEVLVAVENAVRLAPVELAQAAAAETAISAARGAGDRWRWLAAHRTDDPVGSFFRMRALTDARVWPPNGWSDVLVTAHVAAVRDAQASTGPLPRLQVAALAGATSFRARTWSAIIDALDGYGWRFRPDLAAERAGSLTGSDGEAAIQLILDELAGAARDERDWYDALRPVGSRFGMRGNELASLAAGAVLRRGETASERAALALVRYIAWAVASERLGAALLEEPPLRDLGAAVPTRDGRDELKWIKGKYKANRAVRDWLGRLEGDARRAAKAHR